MLYYVAALYIFLPAHSGGRWLFVPAYWICIGLLYMRVRPMIAQVALYITFITLVTFIRLTTITRSGLYETMTAPAVPLLMFAFVVLPTFYFAFTFDAFELVKDIGAVCHVRMPAYLLLVVSIGAMFRARLREVEEYLCARGIDTERRRDRLLHLAVIMPPLVIALIQEAAYRQTYALMLGCSDAQLPQSAKGQRASVIQKCLFTILCVVALGRVLYLLRSLTNGR